MLFISTKKVTRSKNGASKVLSIKVRMGKAHLHKMHSDKDRLSRHQPPTTPPEKKTWGARAVHRAKKRAALLLLVTAMEFAVSFHVIIHLQFCPYQADTEQTIRIEAHGSPGKGHGCLPIFM